MGTKKLPSDPEFNHGASGFAQGCRCNICREDKILVEKIYKRVQRRCAQFVRDEYPGTYDLFMDQEYKKIGRERKPVGRPADPNSNFPFASYGL